MIAGHYFPSCDHCDELARVVVRSKDGTWSNFLQERVFCFCDGHLGEMQKLMNPIVKKSKRNRPKVQDKKQSIADKVFSECSKEEISVHNALTVQRMMNEGV